MDVKTQSRFGFADETSCNEAGTRSNRQLLKSCGEWVTRLVKPETHEFEKSKRNPFPDQIKMKKDLEGRAWIEVSKINRLYVCNKILQLMKAEPKK